VPDTVKAGLADLAAAVLARDDGPAGAVLGLGLPDGDSVVAAGHRQLFDDGGPLPDPPPMTPWTAHDLGSVTKVVGTTTMLMTLVSAGRLTLDDELELLLRHRAGLWEWWPTYAETAAPLDVVHGLPRRYPVDAGRHYSDLGFMLLGSLVCETTGQDLPGSFETLVSGPFGLPETRYGEPVRGFDVAAGQTGDEIERRMIRIGEPYPVPVDPDAFTGWRTGVLAGEVGDGNAFHSFGGAAGHAGLFSTPADLLRWGRGLLASYTGDGPLDAAVVERFFAPGPDPGQRLGFRSRTVGGCLVYEHPGFPGAGVGLLPEHRAIVVLLTNRLHRQGPPPVFEPWWAAVLAGTHELLREESPCE
jgi:serine-type D-Ala-D-Ala carboxypeptidase